MKNAIAFLYRVSLTTRVSSEVDLETTREVKTNDQERDDVGSKEDADGTESGSYCISSEIPEEWVLMPQLMHSTLLFLLVKEPMIGVRLR